MVPARRAHRLRDVTRELRGFSGPDGIGDDDPERQPIERRLDGLILQLQLTYPKLQARRALQVRDKPPECGHLELLDARPRVILVPGLGMFTAGRDARTAGIVASAW